MVKKRRQEMKRPNLAILAFVPVFAAFVPAANAQMQINLPQASPAATVTQAVGLADFTVSYHRPAVNKREVWGKLVPYGEIWRAGANENTTLTASTPFTFGGKALPAGTYGVHVLPTAGEWTFILSSESHAWGSFSYDEKEDVARVAEKPAAADFTERLAWTFDDPTNDGATLTLHWEKLKASVPIGVDAKAVTLASIREQLRGLPRFGWQGWNQAAAWCLRSKTNLEQAMTWADRSISMTPTYQNLRTKAGLLELKGDKDGAAAARAKAQALATEADINAQGYTLLGEGKTDEAIAVFRKNAADHPGSWNVWDSLAEGLEKKGDKAGAVENYTKALSMAPEDQKKRLTDTLARLR
jgi:tetratricopeptide (TPR) repeat protein